MILVGDEATARPNCIIDDVSLCEYGLTERILGTPYFHMYLNVFAAPTTTTQTTSLDRAIGRRTVMTRRHSHNIGVQEFTTKACIPHSAP